MQDPAVRGMSRLQAAVVLVVLLTGACTAKRVSFEMPPIQDWLPKGNSTEPIYQIYTAIAMMLSLLEPLDRKNDTTAMDVLYGTVSAKVLVSQETRSEKDYADIIKAARWFAWVYRGPRWRNHAAHDVRVLQLFTTWMLFVVDAFKDVSWTPMYDVYPLLCKQMRDVWDEMDHYVKQAENGTPTEESYPALWVALDFICRNLMLVLY